MNEKDFYPNDISPTEEEIVYINLRASFLASIETHKQRVNLILYINQPNVRKEYSDLQWKVGKLLEAISRSKDALTLSTWPLEKLPIWTPTEQQRLIGTMMRLFPRNICE